MNCPVCEQKLRGHMDMTLDGVPDQHIFSCPRCGRYSLTEAALMLAQMADEEERAAVVAWIDEQRASGQSGGLELAAARFVSG